MINEFMQVAKSIPSSHLTVEDKLLTLPKGNTIRVLLSADGECKDVEVLDNTRSSSLRKYMPNNFKSFPGFNQLLIPTIDIWKSRMAEAEQGQKQEEYKRLCGAETPQEAEESYYGQKGLYAKAIKGLKHNLIEFPRELRKDIGSLLNEDETLHKLLEAMCRIKDEKGFLAKLENICYMRYKYDLTKPVSCFFDMDNEDYKDYPMAHKRTLDRLNEVLCKRAYDKEEDKEGVSTLDAFGEPSIGAKDLMRFVPIPILGLRKMRSSNKDVRAQTRYHMTGSESFPMGRKSRVEAENALRYLVGDANDGFTFGRVSPDEILLAYPADMAIEKKIPLVRMLGGGNEDEREQLVFRAISQKVIDLLKGEGGILPNRELRIFSIRKMDDARTKVVYYRNLDVATLMHASEEWDCGCHNLPALDVRDWSHNKENKGRNSSVSVEIETVFPVKLYQCLNKYYKRDFAKENIKVARFKPNAGIELMLMDETDVGLFAQHVLSQVMIQASNYYRDLCVCLGQKKISSAKDKGIHLGILGLLLYKLKRGKEEYMKDTAFLLGKFLRIADGLHKCYCDSERNKKYANELCGSALISSMMENPVATLAQLGQRATPYVKWAQACQKKEFAALSHWWLNQWQSIADILHTKELPTRLNDAERAELFLGYLSSLPKKDDAQEQKKEKVFETTKEGE